MPCDFFELFTIHPAYLWARETLILVLKLWTNRSETFSIACIISVVETYLCHNQLVKRQYFSGVTAPQHVRLFPESESWKLKCLFFFSTVSGRSLKHSDQRAQLVLLLGAEVLSLPGSAAVLGSCSVGPMHWDRWEGADFCCKHGTKLLYSKNFHQAFKVLFFVVE